jgi:hypothetical protein
MNYRRVFAIMLVVGGVVATFLVRPRRAAEAGPKHVTEKAVSVPPSTPIKPSLSSARTDDMIGESVTGSASARSPAPVSSPFAALKATEEEARVLHDAEQQKIADCMRQRGFDYSANPHTDVHDLMTPHFENGDVVTASRTGYGLAEGVERGDEPLVKEANEERLSRMSPDQRGAWEIALYGSPQSPPITPLSDEDRAQATAETTSVTEPKPERDACVFRAQRELYGEGHDELQVAVNALYDDVEAQAVKDTEYLAGLRRWRQCMLERNHPYPLPGAAEVALEGEFRQGKLSLDELRVKEVDVALVDASCYVSAGLVKARFEIERDIVARNADRIRTYLASREKAVRRSEGLARR